MNIGMIGLGKMGFNLAQNLLLIQHQVFVYDVNPDPGNDMADGSGKVVAALRNEFGGHSMGHS